MVSRAVMPHEPQLAPPGAGLPWPELMIGRWMFSRRRKKGTREDFDRTFREVRERIRKLVDGCPPELRGERVLIPRLRGLEDSSRNWSVWMTLEHLRICNEAFAGIIPGLASGKTPATPVSTADVKPSPGVGAEADAGHEQACDTFLSAIADVPDLTVGARFPHPWFGPLDAAGWHALAAMHMGIHRGQIERITDALRR